MSNFTIKRLIVKNLASPTTRETTDLILKRGHVDVRGTWPTLVEGLDARELTGAPRSISLPQARDWVPPPIRRED